jgi:hypothetical protein
MVKLNKKLGVAAALAFNLHLAGCSGNDISGGPGPDEIPTYGPPGCVGIGCMVRTNCSPTAGPTSISGVVSIPAGTLPLYNAKVYIPSGEVPAVPPTGASCDRCDMVVPNDAVSSAVTDINGRFTLNNVPTAESVPVVIRVGKWRRVITVNTTVSECSTKQLDPEMTRLPRNQSEGNIPKIALSTGDADALECILRRNKLGLDETEFTNPNGTGRVNLYDGENGTGSYMSGGNFPDGPMWWNDASNKLLGYDIVMLSCEGAQNAGTKQTAAYNNLKAFLDQGGRVFASHWHNVWIQNAGAPLNTMASFANDYSAGDTTVTTNINQGFDKGKALADWLQLPAVKGNDTDMPGQLSVRQSRQTVSARSPLTQDWVNFDPPGNYPLQSQYFSFNTPIPTAAVPKPVQCGQMVFTDLHVSGAGASATTDASADNLPFPSGCKSPGLTPQEKALIFMLFDLTNCLMPPPIG